MLNGVQVLGSIDGAIEHALDQVRAVDKEIASLTEQRVALRQEQSKAYQSLARLRMDEIAGEGVVRSLSAAEQQARDLLDQRSEDQRAIDEQLEDLGQELARLTEQRSYLASRVAQDTEALEDAERTVLEALAATDDYKAQFAEAEKAEAIARHSEQKTTFAEEDRVEKGKPYEDDPLFAYLWERGWGTSRYRAGPIARFFDGKVSDLIDYDKARPNYTMLLEIPKRLAEHAERQRAIADEQANRLESKEEEALARSEVGARAKALADADSELDEIEKQIEDAQQRRNEILSHRTQLSSGQDERTKEALQVLIAAVQRQDLQSLKRQAERTPSPEDDTVVDRVQDIEADIAETEALLKDREAMRDKRRQRLQEVEQLRRDQRQRRYGRDVFDFQDSSMLNMLLTEILAGTLSRDAAWDQINRRRRPRVPGGWGGGGPRLPRRRGGFGGGGFRTGGRLSGKGFRTGGSF